MDDALPLDYLQMTEPWQSAAGEGPLLRGRRSDRGSRMIHFLHGNGFCGGVYWPFLRGFAGDYGLFCHDLEGHGASDAPARYSGTRAIVRRVPQVIAEQCGARPLIGMGHSFGAAVTMAVAADAPRRFDALVLLDPIFLPTPLWLGSTLSYRVNRNPMAQGALRRRDRWPSRDAALAALRNRGIYQGWREDSLASFIDHATRTDADGSRVLCCPKTLEAAIFGNPVYPWRRLARIDCPTLFLYGESSYPFFKVAAEMTRRINPRIEIHGIAGGHCFMQEDPERATAVVRDFLRRRGL
ncbi:alpha/beta hydrolase [Fontimonas sp. SYSU GA230001]|uniref:alpha/beta fold hydrolase n=1 Tax=Fontimonas sp. SYSU GA230001 TaxID=3142450 RepID=UPI0032B609FB